MHCTCFFCYTKRTATPVSAISVRCSSDALTFVIRCKGALHSQTLEKPALPILVWSAAIIVFVAQLIIILSIIASSAWNVVIPLCEQMLSTESIAQSA